MSFFHSFDISPNFFKREDFSRWPFQQFSKSCTFASWVIVTAALLALAHKLLLKLGSFISTKPVNLSESVLDKFVELPTLPVFGPLHHFFLHRNDIPGLLTKWSYEYGSCTRTKLLGRNILSVQDPELLKHMLSSTDNGHLEKQQWFYKQLFVGVATTGILVMPAKDWFPHRKALNSLFTYEALKGYLDIYEKHAEKLAQDLMRVTIDRNLSSKEHQSYSEVIHIRLLDIIAEITIGKTFESVLGYSGALEAHDDLYSFLSISGDPAKASFWRLVPGLWNVHPMKKKMDKHLTNYENAIKKIIKSHVPRSDSKFALDLMINLGWSDAEILPDVITLIVAGHETISGAFCFLLWLLAIEQSHQAACHKEIDEVFDKLEQTDNGLNMAHINEMKYLERCIKETLRLFPSIAAGIIRDLKSALALTKGMEVKAGTILLFSPYVLHRDPKIYPDPEKFDPDRFLPENVRKRHAYAYLPFSAGIRNCIGWKASMLELVVVSAVILRHFRITTTDSREDIKLKLKLTIAPTREPYLLFERRNKCSKNCCGT